MNPETAGTTDSDSPDDLRTLADALGDLQPSTPAVPAALDEAILARARLALARPRRRPVRILRWAGTVAAAAAALLISLLSDWPHAARNPMDVDRSGRVDILDAFLVAKRVETGPSPDPGWDFNHDGKIDRQDADVVAMAAVKVDRGGRP